MVGTVVDRVDSDRVDSKALEQLNVVAKSVEVEERVGGIRSTTGLIGDTTDVEPLVTSVECVAASGDLYLSVLNVALFVCYTGHTACKPLD